MRKTILILFEAFQLFIQRRGANLAAASSFYVIITIVPLVLLMVRLIGFFIGDLGRGEEELFYYAANFFPQVAPEVLEKVRAMVSGPLFGDKKFTILNFVILTMSSLSFFNSIWSGLYLITNDKSFLSFWRNLKGIFVIGVTIALVSLSLTLPSLFMFVVNMAQKNMVVDFVWEYVPMLRPALEYFQSYDITQGFLVRTNLLHGLLFIGYFTFLYRWFFSRRVPIFNAFIAAATFVISLFAGKSLFLVYFLYVRDNLMRNYGDFYTAIVGLMWLYFVMCFFFFGACLCHVLRDEPLYKNIKQMLGQLRRKKVEERP